MSCEIWKWVKGYEGEYLVSSRGNVVSIPKNGNIGRSIGHDATTGYIVVTIHNKMLYVHRLVAEAFIPNTNNLPEINHIDGNKKNNNVENLEWASYSDNITHAYKTGLRPIPINNKYANKFNDEQIRAIRNDD